jgi:H+/Cl- antiporter ClcA
VVAVGVPINYPAIGLFAILLALMVALFWHWLDWRRQTTRQERRVWYAKWRERLVIFLISVLAIGVGLAVLLLWVTFLVSRLSGPK